MKDINGTEIMTGQVVEIKNAFFKNDNGTYFVRHSPGDPDWCGNDYSLRRIKRNGELTKTNRLCFWPICTFVSSKAKNAEAKQWNAANATIEVKEFVKTEHIAAHFAEKADGLEQTLKRYRWDFGEESKPYKDTVRIQEHYRKLADTL